MWRKEQLLNSKACRHNQIKFLEASDTSSDSEPDSNYSRETTINRVTQAAWTEDKPQYTHVLKKISPIHRISNCRNVCVRIGETKVNLFTDTGSEFTIPPSMYDNNMGRIIPAETNLRAWGSRNKLDVKGMILFSTNRK